MKKDRVIKLYRSDSFFHVYNRGNNKALIFLDDKDYKMFKGLMYRYAKINKVTIIVYCFMPNHYHFLFKMKYDLESISQLMRAFMTAYVMFYNRRHSRVGHLFQGPFQARRIINRKDLFSTIAYIKSNPIEAGLTRPENDHKYRWLFVKKAFSIGKGLP